MAIKSFEEASVKAEEKPYVSLNFDQAIKVERCLIDLVYDLEEQLSKELDPTNQAMDLYAKYTARKLHTTRRALATIRKSNCGPIASWGGENNENSEPIYWPFEEDLV